MSSPSATGSLPLFVFPTSLNFYSDEPSSHQQVLTVYNPYNFTLKYKVLSTAPKKYRVVEAEGSIKSRCCVDIYIKHKDVSAVNERIRDKFRLQVTEQGQKSLIGRKDIVSVLLPTREQQQQAEEQFESLPTTTTTSLGLRQQQQQQQTGPYIHTAHSQTTGVNAVVLVAAVLCVVVLMLPTQLDVMATTTCQQHNPTTTTTTMWSDYIHVTVHQKLIAAYILGLVTMVLLRS